MAQDPLPSSPNSPGWSRWIERLRAVTQGRFSIIRELGRGGFAAVFLAQQHKPSRRVAIKLLLPTHLESAWALDHFRGESQKIAEWRHQSVVTIYEVHEVEDMFFFVMSYVEGGSLYDLIQAQGPLSIPMAKSVLAQMGSALQYAHRQGVTHRDIKPQNVLIDGDGGAVVTDFGIAKQAGGTSHTVTGMIFGTPQYMSPEQCRGAAVTPASDQYALGIVAYEMLSGKPPFEGAPMSVLISHIQDEVPLVRTVRPDCPPELEAAIARMLAKNPEDRFPSVGEAMQAAGAAELPDFSAERKKFGEAAMRLSVQANATVLDLKSIPPSIEVGDRISIEATAKTVMGDPVTAGSVEFSLAESTVASIDRDKGTLIALEPGKATLVVRSGGVEQTVQVNIVPPKVA
ncbi:MAG TPA: serine/threonine-protein kinase, partial [Gemmatimonadaceae bacterium]|nr:serine/threonine-protein kinase [Gemmatimonadaceae bacterium]